MDYQPGLLSIDMQEDFVQPSGRLYVPGARKTVPRIRQLLDFFREHGLPRFHVVRSYRPDGSDVEKSRLAAFDQEKRALVPGSQGQRIIPELTPRNDDYLVTKKRFSAFMFTELDLLLRRLGCQEIAICGTQLPICVRCTAFDALALDYQVYLITDATSARDQAIAQANIADMSAAGINCLPALDYLQRLSN